MGYNEKAVLQVPCGGGKYVILEYESGRREVYTACTHQRTVHDCKGCLRAMSEVILGDEVEPCKGQPRQHYHKTERTVRLRRMGSISFLRGKARVPKHRGTVFRDTIPSAKVRGSQAMISSDGMGRW